MLTGHLLNERTHSLIVTKAVQNQDKNKFSGGAPPSWQNFSIWPSLVSRMVRETTSLGKLFPYKSSLQKPQSQMGVLQMHRHDFTLLMHQSPEQNVPLPEVLFRKVSGKTNAGEHIPLPPSCPLNFHSELEKKIVKEQADQRESVRNMDAKRTCPSARHTFDPLTL